MSENKGQRAIFPNAAHQCCVKTLLQNLQSNSGKLYIPSSLGRLPSEHFLLSVSGFLFGSKLGGEQLPMCNAVHVKKVLCSKGPFKVGLLSLPGRGGTFTTSWDKSAALFLLSFLRRPPRAELTELECKVSAYVLPAELFPFFF